MIKQPYTQEHSRGSVNLNKLNFAHIDFVDRNTVAKNTTNIPIFFINRFTLYTSP